MDLLPRGPQHPTVCKASPSVFGFKLFVIQQPRLRRLVLKPFLHHDDVICIVTHPRSYVKLHQPYSQFTAGEREWSINRHPGHLATKTEILGQFVSEEYIL